MKGSTKSLLWIGVSILFVFFVFQISCQKQEKEIPVTSYSDEAKQLFIEARDKYEFLRREKAEVLLREALEKATKNAYRASEGEQFLISALKAHYWEKDYAKAIKVYKQLIDIYPKDARACWLLARVYRDLGDSAKAIEQDQKAITINKDFAPAYKDLGYRYSAKGDYKKAEKYFQKYLHLTL
jgi:tetratricopeptide (TPR) repeat protein